MDVSEIIAGIFTKQAGDAELSYGLAGRLYLSKSGWLLLSVPNSLTRGAFQALHEHGVELPPGPDGGEHNGHLSVATPEDVEKMGGPDAVNERGRVFHYTLGPIRCIRPDGWKGISKVWFISVRSPDLEKFRKSYGLSAIPDDGNKPFHITIGVRRTSVLHPGGVSKAATYKDPSYDPEHADECCPHCGARLERGDDGKCNRCGKPWPEGEHAKAAEHDEIKVPVPKVRQGTPYTCGAASLEAVDEAFGGEPLSEQEIAREMHTTPDAGTSPDAIVREAKRLGLRAELKSPMSLEALEAALDSGKAVICAIQAWGDPENYPKDEEGHYVVATGYDEKNVYFQDPALDAGKAHLAKDDFVARWHDRDGRGQSWHALGITIDRPGVQANHESAGTTEKISEQGIRPLNPRVLSKPMHELASLLLFLKQLGEVYRRIREKRAYFQEEPIIEADDDTAPDLLKSAATGIPDRSNYGDLAKLLPNSEHSLIVQRHNSARAGLHNDIRVGTPELGLYSWATRRELPAVGGKSIAMFRQPLHDYGYGSFEGTLPSGYGAGEVRKADSGKLLVTKISPNAIHFTRTDKSSPEQFVLFKPTGAKREHDWMLRNVTKPQQQVVEES